MDAATIEMLNRMTSDFYQRHATSFSQTRKSAWPGWHRVAETLKGLPIEGRPLVLLDLASGNGRFERFLEGQLPGANLHCLAVDNCAELTDAHRSAPDSKTQEDDTKVAWRDLDVVAALANRTFPQRLREFSSAEPPALYDVCVCFGFLHHVPSRQLRRDLLLALLNATRPGGLVAVSLWRFMDSTELAHNARALQPAALMAAKHEVGLDPAQLEPGDYLLGWQGDCKYLRYCHHFTSDEVDWLLEQVGCAGEIIARYRSDGRTHTLNEYLILRRTTDCKFGA